MRYRTPPLKPGGTAERGRSAPEDSSMIQFLALATLVLASLAVADDAKRPGVLEAELVKSSGPGGRFGLALPVRLIGAKEAAVATDGFRVKVERGDKQVTVKLVLAEGKDSKGRSVIPSADALGI